MTDPAPQHELPREPRWHEGVTRYQWVVLVIASLGWVFDVFEGQIFVASMMEAMPSLVPAGEPVARYNNIALGAFLLGGALGGILFGMLSDRIGRKRTLSLTILVYSAFTCVSAVSAAWWHLAAFRFLVAMGVGGEWAVASSLVAEVFPQRARARVSGIFHATSVLGTYLATAAGYFIVGNPLFQSEAHPSLPWRLGFVVGALPAVLILWIRRGLREPESWEQARARASADASQSMGRVAELFQGELRRRTLVGVSLATVGLATFWGVHIYGKNLMRRDMSPYFVPVDNARIEVDAAQRREALSPLLQQAQRDAVGALTDSETRQRVAELFGRRDWQQARFELRPAGDPNVVRAVAVLPPPKVDDRQDAPAPPLVEILYESNDHSRVAGFVELMTAVKNRINERLKLWEMCGMLLVTTGGGLGLLAFGPICERVGRRSAFLIFHVGGLVCAVATFQWAAGRDVLFAVLPVFGFLTLGMHAGYAIYFPELYPTRLRGTGAGFCFNAGRIMVPPVLYLSGWLQDVRKITPEDSYSLLGLLYLAGVLVLFIAPETKGRQLPE